MKEFIVLYEVDDAGTMERQYTVWADTPEDAARTVITAHLPVWYGKGADSVKGDRVVGIMERTGFLKIEDGPTPLHFRAGPPMLLGVPPEQEAQVRAMLAAQQNGESK